MSQLIFLAHLPLLRMEQEEVPFAGGWLWRVPFETYDSLSLGAFSDHRRGYEETAPVFFRFDAEFDLPELSEGVEEAGGAIELKTRSDNWASLCALGFPSAYDFHQGLVDRAWVSLVLAAPAAALPSPRLSVTFVHCPSEACFELSDRSFQTLRVQGDADQEYLFLPEAAGPPLSSETIEHASGLAATMDATADDPDVAGAIGSLVTATAPVLSPAEQLTLCVVALESLLLPEIRSGLGRTFATRLGALLATSPEHLETLKRGARRLYDARSASLHGAPRSSARNAADAARRAHAQQLLGASICGMARRLRSEPSLDALRSQLDAPPRALDGSLVPLPLADPPGLRPADRLRTQRGRVAGTFSSLADLSAPEGSAVGWCPLIGLATEDVFAFGKALDEEPAGTPQPPVLMPLSGPAISALEEKDIARDSIGVMRPEQELGASVLCLAVQDASLSHEDAASLLERPRDLGVLALRLAGFGRFHDPELLGSYTYIQSMRYRRATVLRQTVLQAARTSAAGRVTAADMERVLPAWDLLTTYDARGRHFEIDHILTLFRRAFDRRFVPARSRPGLLLGALEGMLGRFRSRHEPVQLEHLVTEAVGDTEASRWFAEAGRSFRNAVAHGRWDPGREELAPFALLLELVGALIPLLLTTWLDGGSDSGQRPGRWLTERVEEGLTP
ncbi:MAG: hypothetical protein QNK03_25535 [Myxococcota bacterium]|nr:hypothetical protein [Myxococcota bacterium]